MEKRSHIVVNLDDFGQEFVTDDTLKMLTSLKTACPGFKVTMFAIPYQCPTEWIKEIKTDFPWIEFAIHGTDHKDMGEFLIDDPDLLKTKYSVIDRIWQSGLYARGFKAPQWKLSRAFYDYLRSAGFYVATNRTDAFSMPSDKLNYKYDVGDKIAHDMYYRSGEWYRYHGHIQPCYNGLPNRIEAMKIAWPKNSKFYFISDIT